MEVLFVLIGLLVVLFVAYTYGKYKGHETVVEQPVLVQDTEYHAYRVELLEHFGKVVQSHLVYSLSEPTVRVNNSSLFIDGKYYALGDIARFSVSSIRITQLEQ